ncbi:MAG: DNA cytosine methyltransferase [Chloracidobacterium sp.]
MVHLSANPSFSVISLFSGCGGMDLGFRGGFEFLGTTYPRLPFEIVWANDINEIAAQTYRRNLGSHFHAGDIWPALERLPDQSAVIIGGFPCQDISINGRGRGIDGTRSGLYRGMVAAVRQVRPLLFVAENVKGLLMRHQSHALQTILADFAKLGYAITYRLYQAAAYGVPQTRERVFIVGVRQDSGLTFAHPPPTVLDPENYVTARQAIGDLASMEENAAFNHIWSRAKRSPGQGDQRLIADRPGYTIRAECHGNLQWHYALPRRISMREAARLQSFPDTFSFAGKLREMERQIGNAVPPVLAWHIGQSVAASLLGSAAGDGFSPRVHMTDAGR